MCNVCKHEVNNVRLVPFCSCAHFPCMLIYGLCAKGLTTAMCCLACVVRLARTQTFWDCQFAGGGWQRDSRPGPELRAPLYKSLPLKPSQSSDLTEFRFNVCDSPTLFF